MPRDSSSRRRSSRRSASRQSVRLSARLSGMESLEQRTLMAVDLLAPPVDPDVPTPLTVVAPLNAAVAPAAPTALKISYSGPIARSDALSFTFAESPLQGDTWNVLENGVPIAVNTRYYEGLDTDTWKTEIPALPFLSLIHISEPTRPY